MKRMVVGLAFLLAAGCALAGDVVVRDGERAWTFAEVDGTSRLPIEYMRGGKDRDKLEEVTLTRYWIAERMVTEGDFAAVMGRPIREGRNATNLLTTIEWEDAREYCERFTKRYAAQFPTNCIASMPTMLEWAHAVCVLQGRVDFWDRAGTFLFTCSPDHGYLHTLWRDGKRKPEPDENLAWDFSVVAKRQKTPFLGLRMVLIGVTGEMADGYHPIGERAAVVVASGQFGAAQDYLKLAITRGHLASNVLEWCEGSLAFCREDHKEDWEDWSGLVARSSAFAERHGYEIAPFARDWMWQGWGGANAACAAAYERAGISGSFVRIGDLPGEIRENQLMGESFPISISVQDKVMLVDRAITTNTLVQVLTCDFTGDGRKDLVVEDCGAVDADGYWYDFYRQLPNGSYTNVYKAQVVGLCALPKKGGGACGFLLVGKCSDPVLETKLLSLEHGEDLLSDANMRPFRMLDVEEDGLYAPAPFIGGGYGFAWNILEGRGKWFRPLYWPWRQGEVQGHAEAVERAKREAVEWDEAAKRVEELEAKWTNVAARVSVWELPDYAKRFHEIDDYQRNQWKRKDVATAVVFEKMCREAIAMKIEPDVWHYNLACALCQQGRRDEALEALGQAIAAGFDRDEHAQSDDDLASLRDDPRFQDRLMEMRSLGRQHGLKCLEEGCVVTNNCLMLTGDSVRFAFTEKAFRANVHKIDDIGLVYMDLDGKNGAKLEGYTSVHYDEEGVRRGRNRGLATLRIASEGVDVPIIARGTFRPEAVRTDAFDAVEMSKRNVLGLYSADDYPERLDWCILYRGGEAEGLALAKIVRDACGRLCADEIAPVILRGAFATEMVKMIHQAMKEGTDGNVIDVKNIDRERLMELAKDWADE